MLSELDNKIILTILSEEKPITSKDLALKCKVSINTVRNELSIINEVIAEYGFRISSKTSVGHYVEVLDENIARPSIEKLRTIHNRAKRMDNHYSFEAHYIVRRLLSPSDTLNLEEIAKIFFISKSAVNKEVEKAREILGKYDLQLKIKKNYGASVTGSEWNIRQCLLYEHKIAINTIDKININEPLFRSLFYASYDSNGVYYFDIRDQLVKMLKNQHDFYIPLIAIPKIVNYVILSFSRSDKSHEIVFTDEQKNRVYQSKEYNFTETFLKSVEKILNHSFAKIDVVSTCMILMAYESVNFCYDIGKRKELLKETDEFIELIESSLSFPSSIYDDEFKEKFSSFLYILENRCLFGVFSDNEVTGYVSYTGIRTSDLCLLFAKFYKNKHGIQLSKNDALNAFYYFHRVMRTKFRNLGFPYVQNVMVISQYGLVCAESIAANIQVGYSGEINKVTPIEFYSEIENSDDYDIILTDVGESRHGLLSDYHLPIVDVEFMPSLFRIKKLDEYLEGVHTIMQREVLNESCFHHVSTKDKNEVFTTIANQLVLEEDKPFAFYYDQLQENDQYINLERNNEIVFFPIFDKTWLHPKISVFINDKGIKWNNHEIRMFIVYPRIPSLRLNQIIDSMLVKFIEMEDTNMENLINSKTVDANVLKNIL